MLLCSSSGIARNIGDSGMLLTSSDSGIEVTGPRSELLAEAIVSEVWMSSEKAYEEGER